MRITTPVSGGHLTLRAQYGIKDTLWVLLYYINTCLACSVNDDVRLSVAVTGLPFANPPSPQSAAGSHGNHLSNDTINQNQEDNSMDDQFLIKVFLVFIRVLVAYLSYSRKCIEENIFKRKKNENTFHVFVYTMCILNLVSSSRN